MLTWKGRRIGWISFREQLELLRDVIRRCLGEPTKPIDQTMDSVLDGDGGMAVALRELPAGEALDFGFDQYPTFG